MCGIAGVIDYSGSDWRERVARMQRALLHRGPDGRGDWASGPAWLASTRLAIVDPAGGAQPMVSADGRHVLVYNGEVWNHESLRARLDWPFRTRSDAEVVLAACARLGEAALHELNGMFALFYWDALHEVGFAARDRLGVKPLVWAREGRALLLASEAKALRAGLAARARLHEPSFVEWVACPALSGVAHGMFEDVEALPAGGVLRVARDEVQTSQWWSWRHEPSDVSVDDLASTLRTAVADAARAELPVGLFLSGGLDSTILAAAAPPDRAWTVTFDGQAEYDYARSSIVASDDTPFAALAARELGVAHSLVPVERPTLAERLRRVAIQNDALPAWEQEIAQDALARAASRHVKVVLVGDAADETHYGYHFLLAPDACASPESLLRSLGAESRLRLLPAARRRDVLETLAARYRDLAAEDWDARPAPATTALIVARWLARLLHNGDVHTMAAGLEARVPFADTRLVELARRVRPEVGAKKALLRRAAPAGVPEAIRWRKKSALPKDQGAETVYKNEARRHLDALGGWMDRSTVAALCESPRPLSEVERAMLFSAIVFAHFADRWELV